MRYQRKNNTTIDFLDDIETEINAVGIKSAVCILLDEDEEIRVVAAKEDDVFQIAGLIDLGKTVVHNSVLYNED